MFNFEKEILEFVQSNPGCDAKAIVDAIGHPNAENEANYMVRDGKLERHYGLGNPYYYIPYTLEENVIILFDSGVFKTRIAEMMNITRNDVDDIINRRCMFRGD